MIPVNSDFYKQEKLFKIIGDIADNLNIEAYLVGGYVRDLFLYRESKDIDIVVVGSGIEFAAKVAQKLTNGKYQYFQNFGTAQLEFDGMQIEFVGARKESYERNSRKPVVENGTLHDDQLRRDFTINAMGICLNKKRFGELIDPFNGINHIENCLISTPTYADETFSDDPLRMMRAIRFASQLGFKIDDNVYEAIIKNKNRIEIVSQERITEELNKIILSPMPSIGFELLFDTGLLKIIFPQMVALYGVETKQGISHKDNFYHTIQVLDNIAKLSNDLWLRWAAILHDIAKPATKKFEIGIGWTFHGHEDKGSKMVKDIFRQLRLPLNEKMRFVEKLVLLHLRPIVLAQEKVTDSAVRRLIMEAGEDIDALMLLCNSDITSKNEKKVERIKRNFEIVKEKIKEVEAKDNLRNWQPIINGNDILNNFNITNPKQVGILKNALREAILEGEVENNRESSMEFLINFAEKEKINLKNSKIT